MSPPCRMAALCGVALAALVLPGCAKKLHQILAVQNQPPVVRLSSTIASSGGTSSAELRWTGADADGRVDHYLVTADPGALRRETEGWARTAERARLLPLRRAVPGKASAIAAGGVPFQLFAVRAVDDRGAVSAPAYQAFFGEDIAPTVTILEPRPSALIFPQVAPTFTITWQGSDPDGPDGRVAMYKYKLFRVADIPQQWLQCPDSLLAALAPAFTGWDSVRANVTQVTFENLSILQDYLFVITALDAQGAYDPVFSLDKNMLRFFVSEPGRLGPRLTLYNSDFFYQYMSGGIWSMTDGPSIQVPADRPVTVNWYADPMAGARITGYRWLLDPVGLWSDSPQRKNPHDVHEWSAWSTVTSVTIGPFAAAAVAGAADPNHMLYLEAQQTGGLVSLGSVRLRAVSPSFTNDLLVVDDTRLTPDHLALYSSDSLARPQGAWPTAAELDTFLFARGGFRWRMTAPGSGGAPAGQQPLSKPGIFEGYPYDTFGTRRGLENPTIPLAMLGQYRHIVWMVDALGAQNASAPTDRAYPITALRYMCYRNRENTLAVWSQMGGSLWALGGGFGDATNTDWNVRTNDISLMTYSSINPSTNPDLGPGRFMYDFAHWRSTFVEAHGIATGVFSRVDQVSPFAAIYSSSPDFWTGEPLADPRYAALPLRLRVKTPAADGLWPMRSSYPTAIDAECLRDDNHVLEPAREHGPMEAQALDTLYLVFARYNGLGFDVQPGHGNDVNPVMTYYHGRDCGPVVFSGFDIWHWQRADCVALVDVVLNRLWGLSRSASAAGPAAARVTGRGVSRR